MKKISRQREWQLKHPVRHKRTGYQYRLGKLIDKIMEKKRRKHEMAQKMVEAADNLPKTQSTEERTAL